MSVVTVRPVICHKWDGSVFHVRIFKTPEERQQANDGPWFESRREAKACFTERPVAAPEERATVIINGADRLADAHAGASQFDAPPTKRNEMFAFLKARGVKAPLPITNAELSALVKEVAR